MNLDTTQLQVLAAAIAAETDPAFVISRNAGATGEMAAFFNTNSEFVVWKSNTLVDDVFNAVVWASMTPTDAPDATQEWMNRALACQGKQFNLQTMLTGRSTIRSDKNLIRAGLNDCLTNVPSGAGGTLVAAGWAGVKLSMQRFACKGEALFTSGTGTTAAPGNLGVEGTVTDANIVSALNP